MKGKSIYTFIMISAVSLLFWFACGGGGGGTAAGTAIDTAQVISGVTFVDGKQTNLPVDGSITLSFARAMDSSTFTSDTFYITGSDNIPCTAVWNSDYTEVVCTPSSNLSPCHDYTLTTKGGTSGVKLEGGSDYLSVDYTSTFSTVGRYSDDFSSDTLSANCWKYSMDDSELAALNIVNTNMSRDYLSISNGILTFDAPTDYILHYPFIGGDGVYMIYKEMSDEDVTFTINILTAQNMDTKGGEMFDGILMLLGDLNTFKVASVAWTKSGGEGAAGIDCSFLTLPAGISGEDWEDSVRAYDVLGSQGCPVPPNQNWLKLVKDGNVFTGYYSTNGVDFSQMGSALVVELDSGYVIGIGFFTADKSGTFTTSIDSVIFEVDGVEK